MSLHNDLRKKISKSGFTLLELLVVIAIIGVLSAIIIPTVTSARLKAQYARVTNEFRSVHTAIELYREDFDGEFPAEVDRSIMPAGMEPYIAGGTWPIPPFAEAEYDWDNWDDPDDPGEKIYQITVRFCDDGETDILNCGIPEMDWAEGFDLKSALYYCIAGNCRSAIDEPIDYPGYCANCFSEEEEEE